VEVGGRTILEEDLVQELVIVSDHNLVLMPGQTLPLHIFRPRLIALMKNLIETTKTFGSLNIR
jgi:cereblon